MGVLTASPVRRKAAPPWTSPEDITGPEEDIQEPESEDEPLEDPVPDAVLPEDLIDVLVPSSGQIVLNPYSLEVNDSTAPKVSVSLQGSSG